MKEQEKPVLQVTGEDGNIFFITGRAGKALRRAGQGDKVEEMYNRVNATQSYHEALQVLMDYVDMK